MRSTPLPDEVTSIRCTKPDLEGSGIKLEGIVRVADDRLVFEYMEFSSYSQRPNRRGGLQNWLHTLRTGEPLAPDARTIEIPFDALEYLEGRRFWWLWTSIRISTDRLALLAPVPGARQGRIRFLTSWQDQERGRRFVSHANLRLAEWRMRRAEEESGESEREKQFRVL